MRRLFVWLGGAVFVVSLASFAFVYGIALGRPAPDTLSTGWAVFIDIAMFTAFALHHSVMARSGAKAWITRGVPAPLERSVYVWIASILFLAVTWLWRPLPGVAWEATEPWTWVASAAQLCGVWLTFWAAGLIDPLELAGIRQVIGHPRAVEFKVSGPFGLVRHPIYLGWMLIVFGAPLMTMSRLLMAVVSSAYLILAIPWEERSLVEAFGDRYRAYQQRVRWRLVPGLW